MQVVVFDGRAGEEVGFWVASRMTVVISVATRTVGGISLPY